MCHIAVLDIRVLISDTTAWRKEPEENTVILLVLTEQSKQIHCQLICLSPKLYSIYISFGVINEKTGDGSGFWLFKVTLFSHHLSSE